MASADEIPLAIQWHEGMLLAPQHFQQQAQRFERLIHYHHAWADRFHYGVCKLRIDNALLFEGTLRVLELEAVLPDGLVVSYLATRPGEEPLQADVRPLAEVAKFGPLMVHLAIAAERAASGPGDGDLKRHHSVAGEPVTDEHLKGKPVAIPRLKPRLRLIPGNEVPPARFVSMPLLAVRWKSGAFGVAEYLPPQLQTPTDSPLGELCLAVTRRVREKAMYLLETIRSPAITTKPQVIEENKRLLAHLCAGLPAFEALLLTGASHPYALYVGLCGLAGSIAPIGTMLIPPLFPAYDHGNLRKSFESVRDFIFSTIDEGISEVFTAIPLKYDAGTFGVQLEREWMNRVLILGVKGAPGMSDQQIIDWVGSALVGSSSKFKVLRERRLLGANRQAIDRYEGLVASRGTLLFQLQLTPEHVVPNEPLLVGIGTDKPGATKPAELLLYVSNKS